MIALRLYTPARGRAGSSIRGCRTLALHRQVRAGRSRPREQRLRRRRRDRRHVQPRRRGALGVRVRAAAVPAAAAPAAPTLMQRRRMGSALLGRPDDRPLDIYAMSAGIVRRYGVEPGL